MGLVRPATTNPADKTSYMGVAITLGGASLTGIDGLTFKVSGTGPRQQGHQQPRRRVHRSRRLGERER